MYAMLTAAFLLQLNLALQMALLSSLPSAQSFRPSQRLEGLGMQPTPLGHFTCSNVVTPTPLGLEMKLEIRKSNASVNGSSYACSCEQECGQSFKAG